MSRVIDSAGKFVYKVNLLNLGFYAILGLGVFVLIEFLFRGSIGQICSDVGLVIVNLIKYIK